MLSLPRHILLSPLQAKQKLNFSFPIWRAFSIFGFIYIPTITKIISLLLHFFFISFILHSFLLYYNDPIFSFLQALLNFPHQISIFIGESKFVCFFFKYICYYMIFVCFHSAFCHSRFGPLEISFSFCHSFCVSALTSLPFCKSFSTLSLYFFFIPLTRLLMADF